MIYISLLQLNPNHRRAAVELSDAYELHRTLSKAIAHHVEDGETLPRLLFRVEPQRHPRAPVPVIVQTVVEPRWDALTVPDGYFAAPPDTKAGDLQLRDGQSLRFRIRANPTVRKKVEGELNAKGEPRSRRIGLVGADNQVLWLCDRAEKNGLHIEPASVVLQESEYQRTRKRLAGPRRPRHLSVLYEGVLTVRNAQRARQIVQHGLGPAKAFGFGLLSLARS